MQALKKEWSGCCNEDPQIKILLHPIRSEEGKQNLWPVQNETEIDSAKGLGLQKSCLF